MVNASFEHNGPNLIRTYPVQFEKNARLARRVSIAVLLVARTKGLWLDSTDGTGIGSTIGTIGRRTVHVIWSLARFGGTTGIVRYKDHRRALAQLLMPVLDT